MKTKMKMTKMKIAAVLLAVSMTPMNVFAAVPQKSIDSDRAIITPAPRWSEAGYIYADIGSNGTTLYLSASVTAQEENAKITGTLYLEKNVNGKWKKVKSWRFSGKGDLDVSKTCKGTEGTEYRVRVTAKVGSENITETSASYEL